MDVQGHAGPRIELKRGDDLLVLPLVLRETLIGRIDSNHLVLDHPSISRIHARLHREGEKVVIEDCGSTLGTQVNGELIDRAPLKHGDVVKMGAVTFLFLQD
jgi:two-component system cell cycle response regulator